MTSSVVVLGVFVLLVAPASHLFASLSTLLHSALVLQKKITSKRHTGQFVFVSARCKLQETAKATATTTLQTTKMRNRNT
jgi:hypothetical protein